MSKFLEIALVFDPCYKMTYLDFSLKQDSTMVNPQAEIKTILDAINKL